VTYWYLSIRNLEQDGLRDFGSFAAILNAIYLTTILRSAL